MSSKTSSTLSQVRSSGPFSLFSAPSSSDATESSELSKGETIVSKTLVVVPTLIVLTGRIEKQEHLDVTKEKNSREVNFIWTIEFVENEKKKKREMIIRPQLVLLSEVVVVEMKMKSKKPRALAV